MLRDEHCVVYFVNDCCQYSTHAFVEDTQLRFNERSQPSKRDEDNLAIFRFFVLRQLLVRHE